MTTYAIGDLQGCYAPFVRLLDKIAFDPSKDKLWLTGDLVNRGPDSLKTLTFIQSLGSAVTVVLGNHDLHLLAVAHGVREFKSNDSFDDILKSPLRDSIIHWLLQQKLAHYDKTLNFLMVHAGVYPTWDLAQTLHYATEVESFLQRPDASKLLFHLYSNEPSQWDEHLEGWERLRFITNVLTRMRYLSDDLHLDFAAKMPPDKAPIHLTPWFRFPLKITSQSRIVFGHWSALEGKTQINDVYAIDTGCVWGKELTALNLESCERITTT